MFLNSQKTNTSQGLGGGSARGPGQDLQADGNDL